MRYFLGQREVDVTETQPELSEGMVLVLKAVFVDDGSELSDKELVDIEEQYQEELFQSAYEDACNAAHEASEGDR